MVKVKLEKLEKPLLENCPCIIQSDGEILLVFDVYYSKGLSYTALIVENDEYPDRVGCVVTYTTLAEDWSYYEGKVKISNK